MGNKILRSSKFRFLLKLTLVVLLLIYLGKRGFLSLEATRNGLKQWRNILPAFLAMSIAALIAVFRWHLLLRAQSIHLKPVRTFQLAFIGNFFNIALPGAVSGDVVKAIYVAREIQGKRAWALSSILFDRVVGVSALILVSAMALLLSLSTDWSHLLSPAVKGAIWILAAGTLAFYAYLLLVRENHDPLLLFLKKMQERFRIFSSFYRIYEGLRHYHSHRKTVFQVLGLSLLIHLLVTYACLNFTEALKVREIPVLAIFIIVPLGLLFTAIPLLPAGVGTGHAAFLALFHFLGSQRGADVFNLFLLFNLILGGTGGLIYLKFKSREPGAFAVQET